MITSATQTLATPHADWWLNQLGGVDARRLARLLLLAGCYLLAALVSYPLTDLPIHISSIWLPSGVAVILVLRGGYCMLPLVVLCNTIADVAFGGFSLVTATGIGLISAGEAAFVVALLRHGAGDGFRFEVPAIVRFAMGALVLAPGVSAVAAAGWLTAVGVIEPWEVAALAGTWWVSAAMGTLLVVPLLESWRVHGRPRFRGEITEATSVLLVLMLLSAGVFLYELNQENVLLPVLYCALFLMIWCALYLRETGATTAFAFAILAGCLANAHWSADPAPTWVIGIYAVPFALVAMILAAVQRRLEQTAAHRAKQQELERLAYQDALTGLANRTEFERRLEQAVQEAEERGNHVAVVFIDLDGFKPINDTYGHQVGDKLLMAVAGRLRQVVRSADVVARMGGDEFTVLLPDLTTPAEAWQSAERLRRVFTAPIETGGRRIHVNASVGLGLYPDDAATPAELIRQADLTMYAAKCSLDRAGMAGAREGVV